MIRACSRDGGGGGGMNFEVATKKCEMSHQSVRLGNNTHSSLRVIRKAYTSNYYAPKMIV